ncbi:MAG: MFS transporter [Firmicutes bacterium]|nr:MFS transporter [Bacillota bacterium]
MDTLSESTRHSDGGSVKAPMIGNTFAALRHRSFRLYWSGQCVSLIGTWMQSTAQAWLILKLTDSAYLLGLVSSIRFIPTLALSLFTGVIIDRISKRNLILLTQTTLMVLAFGLGALIQLGLVRYWHVLAMSALVGVAESIDGPARQAFVKDMTDGTDLMNAVALNSAIFNLARMLGPALAGLVIGKAGFAPCFFLNGASFLAVIAGLMLVPASKPARPETHRKMLDDLAEGLAYVRSTPAISTVIMLVFGMSLFLLNPAVLVPAFAERVLHQEATGYGLLMSAMGVGAVMGAVALAAHSVRGLQARLILWAAFCWSGLLILLGFTQVYMASAIVLALVGWAQITFNAAANTWVQMNSPDRMRGRIMSAYMLVHNGVVPFGSLLTGWLAQNHGANIAAIVLGMLALTFAILVAFKRTSIWSVPAGTSMP